MVRWRALVERNPRFLRGDLKMKNKIFADVEHVSTSETCLVGGFCWGILTGLFYTFRLNSICLTFFRIVQCKYTGKRVFQISSCFIAIIIRLFQLHHDSDVELQVEKFGPLADSEVKCKFKKTS